jgi:hypothetical protein
LEDVKSAGGSTPGEAKEVFPLIVDKVGVLLARRFRELVEGIGPPATPLPITI